MSSASVSRPTPIASERLRQGGGGGGARGALVTWLLYTRLPLQPLMSVAVMVKVKFPAVVGVPEMRPVVELSVRPGGNNPLETVKR